MVDHRAKFIFAEAQRGKNSFEPDYAYSFYKKKIIALNLTSDEYEQAIKQLCDILEY